MSKQESKVEHKFELVYNGNLIRDLELLTMDNYGMYVWSKGLRYYRTDNNGHEVYDDEGKAAPAVIDWMYDGTAKDLLNIEHEEKGITITWYESDEFGNKSLPVIAMFFIPNNRIKHLVINEYE